MYRLLACVKYNGSLYHGWQKQYKNDNSLQNIIENSLFLLFKYNIKIFCSSRTDVGVHSIGQIFHFDIKKYININSILNYLNNILPIYIYIRWIKYVSIKFNARYDTIAKKYIYIIYNGNKKLVFLNKLVTFINDSINIDFMFKASRYLIGKHNFNSFKSPKCESNNFYKTIFYLNIYKLKNFIFFEIIADSFLYHMVRNIVSSLLLVGTYKYSIFWIKDFLYYRNKSFFNINLIKPYGLYLMNVYY